MSERAECTCRMGMTVPHKYKEGICAPPIHGKEAEPRDDVVERLEKALQHNQVIARNWGEDGICVEVDIEDAIAEIRKLRKALEEVNTIAYGWLLDVYTKLDDGPLTKAWLAWLRIAADDLKKIATEALKGS